MPDDGKSPEPGWQLAVHPSRVLDAVGDAVVITDPAESIVFWSSAAETMFGWSAAEVMGRNVVEVVTPGASADQAAQMAARVYAGERWVGDIDMRRRDGRSFTVRVTATPVLGGDGSPVGLIGLLRDVTEAREMTARLATSQRRFQALIQSSGDLFAIADAEGVITFLDGPAPELLGVEADALVGRSLFDLVRPGDLGRAHALWAQRVSTTTPMQPSDYWVQPADRTWLCLSLLVTNLIDDPSVGGVVVTARDVTAHRHLEEARAAMKGANVALVHAVSEDDLLERICRVIVDQTRYHFAWVGISDPDLPLGARVTAFGDPPTYFDALEHLAGKGTYRGPLLMALETHELQVVHDIAALPETMPWRQLALDYGYRSALALPLLFDEREHGVLAVYSEDPNVFTTEVVDVLTELASDLAFGVGALRARAERSAYRARFEASLEAVVRAVAATVELRDPYTAGHQRQVAELAAAIATDLGLGPQLTAGIRVAASIHDIGKLAVPADILSRPGRLSETEFAIIKAHTQAGHDVVVGVDFPWPVAEMILQHHERLDGSGYPSGLHGEEIAIGARIIAVADTVEAMQCHRPYRPALGTETALQTIAAGRATLFDPDVVDACSRVFGEQGFCFTL
jgi:PAS domain S-box-containing protein